MTASDPSTPPLETLTSGTLLLETRKLVKRFGGVTALAGVDFTLNAGEVHALCGENGAGKSTLIKLLGGVHPYGSYEGEILLKGVPQRFFTVRDAEAVGLSVIHQELALVDEMTVAENIFLGHEPRRYGLVDHERMRVDARKLLERFGIDVPVAARVGELGVGQKQLVEIAKALRKDSRILILDEPSAALTEKEVAVLLGIVRELGQRGVSAVYISHKLDEVFEIAQRITVLRDGQTITTLNTREANHDTVIESMVGRQITELFPRRESKRGDVVLEVQNLEVAEDTTRPPRLSGISFELRAGEVLGIGGLMGAGRSELLLHLFGAFGVRRAGTVHLLGTPLAATPRECIDRGLVLVSEDRKRYGLMLEHSVGFHLSLSSLASLSRAGWVDQDREAEANRELMRALHIKASGLDAPVSSLSGGNQQKVVLGKALMTKPKVVLLDEPTRGVDVGAKHEIYELVNTLTEQGVAVLLVSSELPELIGMSDRILMLAEGRIGGEFQGAAITQEALLTAALTPRASQPGLPSSAGRQYHSAEAH